MMMNGNCDKCGRSMDLNGLGCIYCDGHDDNNSIGDMFTGIAGLAIGGWLAFKVGRKCFSFLPEIKWDGVNEKFKKIATKVEGDLSRLGNNNKRLKLVQSLLDSNDSIEIDQAALMLCATLEGGLKTLTERSGIIIPSGSRGIVDIANILKDANVISSQELNQFKQISYKIRNPAMHGDFNSYDKDQVLSQFKLVCDFFVKYKL
jgi:hypothetical protein